MTKITEQQINQLLEIQLTNIEQQINDLANSFNIQHLRTPLTEISFASHDPLVSYEHKCKNEITEYQFNFVDLPEDNIKVKSYWSGWRINECDNWEDEEHIEGYLLAQYDSCLHLLSTRILIDCDIENNGTVNIIRPKNGKPFLVEYDQKFHSLLCYIEYYF